MLRMLLDIAYPGRHPRIHPPRPVLDVDTAFNSTDVVPTEVPDTVTNTVGDSLASVQGVMTDVGNAAGGDSTLLYASLFVVFFALAVCLYFVFAYRRSLAVK